MERDPRELISLAVAPSRTIDERCEDIVEAIFSAAATEPEVRAAEEEARRHRTGVSLLTQRPAALDALAPGLGTEEAADVFAALTDPEVARTFVKHCGWTWDRRES